MAAFGPKTYLLSEGANFLVSCEDSVINNVRRAYSNVSLMNVLSRRVNILQHVLSIYAILERSTLPTDTIL